MPYLIPAAELALLEQSAQGREGPARWVDEVHLAWHRRQRDSAAALQGAQAVAEAVDRLGDAVERHRLQRRLALTRAEVSALFGQPEAAEAWLSRAQALTDPGSPQAVDAHWTEALVAKLQGQREREMQAHEAAVETARRVRDRERLALARAWWHYEASFTDPSRRWDERQLPAGRTPAIDALLSAAQGMQWTRRAPERAAQAFLHASHQAQRVGLVRHAVICTVNAAAAWQGLGEADRAAAAMDVAAAVVRQAGWRSLLGPVQTRMGALLAQRGHWADAVELLREAVGHLASAPTTINHANACSELALTLMRMGRAPEAVVPMAQALQGYRAAASTDNLALNLIHQGRLMALVGEPAAAEAALAEAQALMDRHGLHALQVGVHEARAVLYRRHPQRAPAVGAEAAAPTAALVHAEQALRCGKALSGWRPPAELLVIMADEWRAAGQAERAYELARQAIDLLQEEAQTARSLRQDPFPLRRAQLPPPRDPEGLWQPAPAPSLKAVPSPLTPQEQRILELLARQYVNKEIANALELGEETVKWHLKKVFAKLAVGSRRRAVEKARVLGLLPD